MAFFLVKYENFVIGKFLIFDQNISELLISINNWTKKCENKELWRCQEQLLGKNYAPFVKFYNKMFWLVAKLFTQCIVPKQIGWVDFDQRMNEISKKYSKVFLCDFSWKNALKRVRGKYLLISILEITVLQNCFECLAPEVKKWKTEKNEKTEIK